jgi:hypothetical protein
MINLYFFIWPSNLGGADTRLKELIQCFNTDKKYKLYCIPNDNFRLKETENVDFLKENNTTILKWEDLPEKTDGFAISFCNFRIFSEDWRIKKIKSMGLKFIWSNDMMWRTPEEEAAFKNNLVDATIYTSNKHFNDIKINKTKEFIVPNYFYLDNYPYIDRMDKEYFNIGKHSRPDKLKFSDNFPLFYEGLKLQNPKYRVMGVDVNFLNRFKWFKFDTKKWELLQPTQKPVNKFLQSLDCYIYNSHYSFTETQCRATIEAMLTGLPVIAPSKENFLNQIWNTQSGFIYNSYEELIEISQFLEKSYKDRIKIGKLSREISKNLWCDTKEHIKIWEEIFNII